MTTGPRTSHRRLVSTLYPSVFVGGTWTAVLVVTLVLHTAVFVALLVAPAGGEFVARAGIGFGAFRPWQLLSYMFLFDTSGPLHFLFTMTIFLMVAGDVSVVMGPRRFLAYYLTCGALAGAGAWLWLLLGGRAPGVIGPTGAVCALIFAFSHYFGSRRIYGLIPARVYSGLLALVLVGGTMIHFTMLHGRGAGTPYLGQLAALAGALVWFRLEPRVRHWRLVHETFGELQRLQQQAMLEEQLDRVLAKIESHGAESLSPAERRCLRKASRVLDRRRRESS